MSTAPELEGCTINMMYFDPHKWEWMIGVDHASFEAVDWADMPPVVRLEPTTKTESSLT